MQLHLKVLLKSTLIVLMSSFFRKLEGLENSDLPLKTHISFVSGSVETACALGLADGIVDLVESGETMRAAKLTALANIMPSQAVLICNPSKWSSNPLINTIMNRIKGVIAAQKYVLISYNIQRNSMQNAFKITPGKKAPTVSRLERDDWVSISAMVLKKACAEIMDQLTGLGAEDILVFSINNCRVD